MRVLFSTTAGAGHFGPMVPVARACAAAGHEVAVAAPASFADAVAKTGLLHLPFPDVAPEQLGAVFSRVAAASRGKANRIVVTEVFGRLDAQAALPTLVELIGQLRPDVVVRDPAEFASLVAAAHAGVPQVQVAISVDEFILTVADWLEEPVRELEAMVGLDPPRGAARILETPTLTTVPSLLDEPSAAVGGEVHRARRFFRFRDVPHPTEPSLPGEWGDPSQPLVYVSFGSVAGSMEPFRGLYPAVLEVFADQPIRVLLTTGTGVDPATVSTVPANAWVTPWWPQANVMTEAALVVGHGGFGTTMGALSAGVPQIVLPLFASDQFFNAERVEAVGAGVQLLGGPDAVGRLPELVTRVLGQPHLTEGARNVAAQMAALPDVSETVAVLEDLASAT